jgi:hypothetical protein
MSGPPQKAAPTKPEDRNKTKKTGPKDKNKTKKTGPRNKKPTWLVTGTWASKLGLEKELRSNAPMAREDLPTTTGSVGETGALAKVEHIR